ncbi:MAG: hypothetical protein RLZZ244_1540 [Verrucomicrobiota bacterium]|jgi:large subunit ribosomal protein L17
MRHQRKTVKLGRSQAHRDALLANQAISLIEHNRITTTLAKAKAVRPFAEKLVTIAKKNSLHARRTALSYLFHNKDAVKTLFTEVAPRSAERKGGYTRIIKLGRRYSDSSEMAILEWVDQAAPAPAPAEAEAASATAPAATTEAAPQA